MTTPEYHNRRSIVRFCDHYRSCKYANETDQVCTQRSGMTADNTKCRLNTCQDSLIDLVRDESQRDDPARDEDMKSLFNRWERA